MKLITLFYQININEKLKSTPNSDYEIGVFIGTLLPFIILVTIAFLVFKYNKNKIKKN